MAIYAIGDVQGCYGELETLLAQIGYERSRDQLWFVGDLVNRGPRSLEVLRYVRSLGAAATVVLGNHDLHLLAVASGAARPRADDTLDEILAAPDRDELLAWLRSRPLLVAQRDYVLVHAGLLPQWSIAQAAALAREVERALAGPAHEEFLAHMYGAAPARWHDTLAGWDCLRVIVNALTRLRFCTPEGAMDFHLKSEPAPFGYLPWFEARAARTEPAIICGHWSALGLKLTPRLIALDSGCVWGGRLSALRLDDRVLHQVGCHCHQAIGGNA